MYVEPQHRTAAKRPDAEARDIQKHVQPQHKNSLEEGRPGSARRSNARQTRRVQNTKTFPSSTREQDKRGVPNHEHDTKRTDTKMKEAGWCDINGVSHGHPAHQPHRHHQSPRCKHERNREKKKQSQQPRREPAELRAPRLPVPPPRPFPVPPRSSLDGRSCGKSDVEP